MGKWETVLVFGICVTGGIAACTLLPPEKATAAIAAWASGAAVYVALKRIGNNGNGKDKQNGGTK